MIDTEKLGRDLTDVGLQSWVSALASMVDEKFSAREHGDFPKWKSALEQLPAVDIVGLDLAADTPGADSASLGEQQLESLRSALLALRPWRKGPFRLCGVDIDTEWRSDFKWQRLEQHISPLTDRNVLDVGSGNGYYALRMRGAGANLVIGIDPTLLFVCQFLAIDTLLKVSRVHVLPCRLNDLPPPGRAFDSTFSMGVLYHQRNPQQHLAELLETLRPGGELVLETLVWPGAEFAIHVPEDRYAQMRNVWHLPTVSALTDWLSAAGFSNIRTVDVTATTTDEQRRTEWMPFQSLVDALDPTDTSRTVEGLPAPTRAILLATA